MGDSQSLDVSLGDVDGDGDIDAFVANNNQANIVWLNDGNGKFNDSQQTLGNSESFSVSLGDVDGDGDLDAFVANYYNQPNIVWLNDGSGKFTDSQQALGNLKSYSASLGDVDGDGDLDAFVANYDNEPNYEHGQNIVWLNDGSGKFTNSQQALGNSKSYNVSLGDVDGDGDLDGFVTNDGQPNIVWLNDGSGKFTNSQQALGNSRSYSVSLGDVDGDGDLDAFVVNYQQSNKVWLNNPVAKTCDKIGPDNLVVNGSFEEPVVSFVDFQASIEGWDLVQGLAIEVDNNFITTPYDGLQFLDIDSYSVTKISQKISTQPGKTYKLTFAFKGNDNRTAVEDNTLNVYWGSDLVEAFAHINNKTAWKVKTYNLEAKSTETVLSFDNLNDIADTNGTRLDGVSINLCQ